ncbi:hypothetical protein L1987_60064 [Smallanthus sonchifolius]|uniref:Uncharacterized protein n=1 Tax=Smallanthus sonchifolius TaxID=185202 RepID=A0ACB9D709_9ASTR|nr:hypothetical protein L1987_60064 [Smallanthus sonchifolius]
MLDLNLTFVHEDMRTAVRGELEESGTSNSSIVNAEGCSSSNVGDDDSVSVAGDGDNFHCFDFDILKVGDTGVMISNSNDEDRTSQSQALTRSEFVTRTLFPTRHEERRLNSEHQVNSLLLFPNNNESEEMRSVHVQQNKLTVQQNQMGKKSRRGPRSRSSQYRGVTFYRRTGRWESHIWDCGKQVYLGGFDTAHAAARAYDRAAIKFRGVDADINFNISDYEEDMNQIKSLSKEDFVHLLRRHSGGFSRGGSKYRGVAMNNCGMWGARTGQVLGKMAYDNAAIKSNTCEGETVASHFGNGHNLDLNLRISTPSCLVNDSSANRNLQLNHGLHDIRSLQAGNPGLPIISEHDQSWTGVYIGGSSSRAWQPHSQSQTPTAASSGFPAPAAPNSEFQLV